MARQPLSHPDLAQPQVVEPLQHATEPTTAGSEQHRGAVSAAPLLLVMLRPLPGLDSMLDAWGPGLRKHDDVRMRC